jgi:molecular chaperone DnaK (HSP70)
MFLVGGFSENRYLQKRIIRGFQHQVKTISVPTDPVAAVVRGAALYGLSIKNFSNADKMNSLKTLVISTRTLKFTYGIKVLSKWKKGHPLDRKIHDDRIYLFETFVKRGTEVEVDQEFISKGYKSLNANQPALTFELLKSSSYNVKYPNEPGIERVGKLRILLSGACNKSITFGFSLGQMEITAFAKNELDGQNVQIKFNIYKDL